MKLVDSHCHLDFPDFTDLDGVANRANAAGVGLMLTISTRVRQFGRLRKIVETRDDVWASIGTHPHQAGEERDVPLDEILRLADHPKVVAIGEAGLDYHYDNSPRADQERGFRTHIAAARETGLALVIHAREADEDVARILEEEAAKGPFKAVLHCYTGGAELARRGLDLGLYLSFSGVLTFRKSDDLRAIAASTPLDRLLIETDAPFLSPEPLRGQRNEPAHVVHTAAKLAEVKGVSAGELAKATTENFFRLFSKVTRPDWAISV